MSIELGMTLTVICLGLLVVLAAVYFYFDILERKSLREYERRKERERNRIIAQGFEDTRDAIWDSCRLSTNFIIKEIKKVK